MKTKNLFLSLILGLSISISLNLKVFADTQEVEYSTFTGDFSNGGDYESNERLLGNASYYGLGFLGGNLVRIYISSGKCNMEYNPAKSTPTTTGFVGIWVDGISQFPQHHLDVWGRIRSTDSAFFATSLGQMGIGVTSATSKFDMDGGSATIRGSGAALGVRGIITADGSGLYNINISSIQSFILFLSSATGEIYGWQLHKSSAQGEIQGWTAFKSTGQGIDTAFTVFVATAQGIDRAFTLNISTAQGSLYSWELTKSTLSQQMDAWTKFNSTGPGVISSWEKSVSTITSKLDAFSSHVSTDDGKMAGYTAFVSTGQGIDNAFTLNTDTAQKNDLAFGLHSATASKFIADYIVHKTTGDGIDKGYTLLASTISSADFYIGRTQTAGTVLLTVNNKQTNIVDSRARLLLQSALTNGYTAFDSYYKSAGDNGADFYINVWNGASEKTYFAIKYSNGFIGLGDGNTNPSSLLDVFNGSITVRGTNTGLNVLGNIQSQNQISATSMTVTIDPVSDNEVTRKKYVDNAISTNTTILATSVLALQVRSSSNDVFVDDYIVHKTTGDKLDADYIITKTTGNNIDKVLLDAISTMTTYVDKAVSTNTYGLYLSSDAPGGLTPGDYVRSNITVDLNGRIVKIADGTGGTGTGGSVAIYDEDNGYVASVTSITFMGPGISSVAWSNQMATVTITGGGNTSTTTTTMYIGGDLTYSTIPVRYFTCPAKTTYTIVGLSLSCRVPSTIGSSRFKMSIASAPQNATSFFSYVTADDIEIATNSTSGLIYFTTGTILLPNHQYGICPTSVPAVSPPIDITVNVDKWFHPQSW